MAQPSYALIGAGGTKSISAKNMSIGALDQWMDQQVEEWISGSTDARKYYKAVPWLFRGVQLRAEMIASMPFEIRSGDEVIDSSDDYQNAIEFLPDPEGLFWLLEASACLTGQAYLLPGRNRFAEARGKEASELTYAAPATMTPVFNDKSGAVVGYERRVNGRKIDLTPEQVLAYWYPDPYVEVGPPMHYPAQAAVAAAGVLLNMDEFVASFWKRGAIKTTLVALEGVNDQKERERFKEVWRKAMQGLRNAWDSLIVNANAVTATIIGEGVKDLQNTELSQGKREDIAAALTIPYTKLFSGSASGLGGGGVADADDIRFYNEFGIPQWKKYARWLNKQPLFLKQGYTIHPLFETIDALQIDETERQAAATDMVNMIAQCATYEMFAFVMDNKGMEFDEDEAKAMFSAKEKKDAEAMAQQQANMLEQQEARGPVGQGGFAVSKPKPKELGEGKAVSDGLSVVRAGDSVIADGLGSGGSVTIAASASDDKGGMSDSTDITTRGSADMGIRGDGNDTGARLVDRTTDAKSVERAQFKRWAAKRPEAEWGGFVFKVLDEDEQSKLGVKKKHLKSIGATSQRFEEELTVLVNEAWANGGGRLGKPMRLLVKQYCEDAFFEGLLDAGSTPETLTAANRSLLDELTDEQVNYVAQFAMDVQDAVEDAAQQDSIRVRIGLWAESIYKIGQRGWATAQQQVKQRIQWHTANDEMTCPICEPLNDKIVDAGQPFALGIYNEPAHPNCRCTTDVYLEAE
jgi:hypothetical protein